MAACARFTDNPVAKLQPRRHDHSVGDGRQRDGSLDDDAASDVQEPVAPAADGVPQLDLHAPKAVHSWREFIGEVGIIVLGVLIALAGEQLVGQVHKNEEVAAARSAIREEVSAATADIRARLALGICVTRRVEALESRLQDYRSGHAFLPIAVVGRPMSTPPINQAWETLKASSAAMDLPTGERLAYGSLYATFAMIRDIESFERDTWLQLQDFEGAPALDAASAMRLRGLISRAEIANEAVNRIGNAAIKRAVGMGVRIGTRPPVANGSLCKPLA